MENQKQIHNLPSNSPKLGGIKHDSDKPDLTLLPIDALNEITRAFMYGQAKYGRANYRLGFKWLRISAAALRHLYAWSWGEDKDPESGLSHLAHAGACICMLLDLITNNLGEDDRTKK